MKWLIGDLFSNDLYDSDSDKAADFFSDL